MPPFSAQITFCHTPDLDATSRFYEHLLGLPLVLDQGTCRIYRVARDAFVGFCTHLEASVPGGIILTLVTDDVDGWYRRLRDRDVEFEGPPAANPRFRIYHCFLRDPHGHRIEIQRFDDPAWK